MPTWTNPGLLEFDAVITGDITPSAFTDFLKISFEQELGAGGLPTPFTPQ